MAKPVNISMGEIKEMAKALACGATYRELAASRGCSHTTIIQRVARLEHKLAYRAYKIRMDDKESRNEVLMEEFNIDIQTLGFLLKRRGIEL